MIFIVKNGHATARDPPLQKGECPLRICSLSKEEFQISKDAKFSPGNFSASLHNVKYNNNTILKA